MSKIATPSNVGFYAVAKERGLTMIVSGPHAASDAHRAVDEQVRPEARARNLSFATFGVVRMVLPPTGTLPTYTVTDGRTAA